VEDMATGKKSSKGRFLYLFDWNAKSRKKLFSNKTETHGMIVSFSFKLHFCFTFACVMMLICPVTSAIFPMQKDLSKGKEVSMIMRFLITSW